MFYGDIVWELFNVSANTLVLKYYILKPSG